MAECGESALVFAQRAIMESVGESRWNLLERNVEYHLTVSDVAERDGDDALLENGRLALTIECGGAGFLKIGPALEALEKEGGGPGCGLLLDLDLCALSRDARSITTTTPCSTKSA